MAKTGGEVKAKAKIVRWRGVLDDSPRVLRRMVAVVLAVAGFALAFTEMGFIDVTLSDGTVGYVVVLMQVVALGALLLGTFAGVGLGLVTGGVLLLHARVLPLDHYELTFITPTTSVFMFGVCGLLLGVLFAFALRNNPGQVRRVVYIGIVCLVVSSLYGFGFFTSVFASLIVNIAETIGSDVTTPLVQQMAGSTASQLGDLWLQVNGTALLMAVVCSLGDFVARKIRAYRGVLGLRTVFGAWLSVVVVLAFMVMWAASFAVVSGGELREAEEDMSEEVAYLKNQLQISNERQDLIIRLFEREGIEFLGDDGSSIEDQLLADLIDHIADENVLLGYTIEDDGVIVVAIDDVIFASDDERFLANATLSEVFSSESLRSISESIENDSMERFIFDDPEEMMDIAQDGRRSADEAYMNSSIAYLYAQDVSGTIGSDQGEQVDYKQTIIMIRSAEQVFARRATTMFWMTLSALVLMVSVFAIGFQLLNRLVAGRIDEMNESLALITDGNLDSRVEVHDTREFESLSEGINSTVGALKGWIAEAETRMDAELATARAIQESALPRTFPPYPDFLKFDIYASMNAARQVGGDFYDFFLVGDECGPTQGKVAFVIADVSGKGVPAALFMMRAKALLHDYVTSGMELGEAITEANRQLIEGNDEGMFVTAWIGVLDYGTGHVDYVNAGHNPPLLWNREGGWQWMRKKSGTVLGLFEITYKAHELDCTPGDTLLLYTDGVTEAFDEDENQYGEGRLLAVAEKGVQLHPRELLESVRADVAAFARDAEQSDDITILTLEYGVPPEITQTLKVPARTDELNRVNEFIHAELDRRLCPQRIQNQLDIAVEELFVNVCHYAYPEATDDKPGSVRIQRTYHADPASITVDIIDEGIPYDPLAKPDAVTPKNIEDVPIGGLGILMAKKCADEMRYERLDGRNIVTVVKRW